MRNLNKELMTRKIAYDSLLPYGFNMNDGNYTYEKNILDDTFKVIININGDNITSKLIDLSLDDEYLMVDMEDAVGEYIGKIKTIYNDIINNVIENCTIIDIFKGMQTKEIIDYIKEKYHDEMEYLWTKFPDNAICRNKINQKWYGIIMTVAENKLGLSGKNKIEIIDLRYQKDKINNIIDNKKIFAGYHMNKQSWITIKLDNSVSTDELCKLIDNSFTLSIDNKTSLSGNSLAKK